MIRAFTETEHLPLPGGSVRLLGAIHQVTGAATLVEQDGLRVLVDCGLAQGRDAHAVRLDQVGRLDAIVLTHGHLDHIGGLPELLDRSGARCPIYATAATLEIARLSLEDSMSLERTRESLVREVLATLRERARPIGYDTPLTLGKSTLWLREAGHILGSASVELVSPSSRLVISGDLGRPNSPILRDPETHWDPARPVDLALVETTYGGRDHQSDSAEIEATLLRVLLRAEREKGKVFVPAFAIGRTQVLLYHIDQLVESGRLQNTPVAVDKPMVLDITETYQKYRKLYDREALEKLARGDDPLDFEDLFAVRRGKDSYRLEEVEGPLVILAGSGMCTGGRIVHHLQAGMDDPRNTLLFVGHQAHGTPGAAILRAHQRGDRFVEFHGRRLELRAKVEVLRGMSAHADRGELLGWLKALPGLRAFATHHGEPAAQRDFADYVERAL